MQEGSGFRVKERALIYDTAVKPRKKKKVCQTGKGPRKFKRIIPEKRR